MNEPYQTVIIYKIKRPKKTRSWSAEKSINVSKNHYLEMGLPTSRIVLKSLTVRSRIFNFIIENMSYFLFTPFKAIGLKTSIVLKISFIVVFPLQINIRDTISRFQH